MMTSKTAKKKKKQQRGQQQRESESSNEVDISKEMRAMLLGMPKGSAVAVVTLLGSLCPITVSHVDAFVQARALLMDATHPHHSEGLEEFTAVLGFISLNPDKYVNRKFAWSGKGQKGAPLSFLQRRSLVEMAIDERKTWMGMEEQEGCTVEYFLQEQFPELQFTHFTMNGADDVLKYHKWFDAGPESRFITMGRPGMTQTLLQELEAAQVNPLYFIVGPELADVSSTQAREALDRYREGDTNAGKELDRLLHPRVKEWCIRKGPWQRQKSAALDGWKSKLCGTSRSSG